MVDYRDTVEGIEKALLSDGKATQIGELLVAKGKITKQDLDLILEKQKQGGDKIPTGEIAVQMGLLSEDDTEEALVELFSRQYNLDFYSKSDMRIVEVEDDVLNLLPESYAMEHLMLPIRRGERDGRSGIFVATDKAPSPPEVTALRRHLKDRAFFGLASKKSLIEAIRRNYSRYVIDLGAELSGVPSDEQARMALEVLLTRAIARDASDIHIEPSEERYAVRFRIDGRLRDVATYDKEAGRKLLGVISIESGFDIAQIRAPRDGHFDIIINGRRVDCRVSIIKTYHDMSCVLRVISGADVIPFSDLGLSNEAMAGMKELTSRSFGLGIVAGPTGSGKTTTLYAAINTIDKKNRKVITLEEPVEKAIPDTTQIECGERVRLPFATALRSVLRHDPDVIIVGEVRDSETAQVSVQGAMTSHLVIISLHATDCLTSITRLLSMDIEPYQISRTLHGVLAQRLLGKLCTHCKVVEETSDEEVLIWKRLGREVPKMSTHAGGGCAFCNSGWSGRMLVSEWLSVNQEIRDLIMSEKEVTINEIRAAAVKNGWRPMIEDAIKIAESGVTTIEEVYQKVVFD